MDFKTRFNQLRNEKRFSQKQIADYLKVSKVTVWQWENGIYEPSNERQLQLADFFNVSLDYLMGRSEIKQNASLSSDDFTIAFSGLSEKLTEEQKKQLIDIANAFASANNIKKQ